MKILTTKQIRSADAFTISHEPIKSIDLMERASKAFVEAFLNLPIGQTALTIVCGPGNNGGDGLAIARLLAEQNYKIEVWMVDFGSNYSEDCRTNLNRWLKIGEVVKIKEPRQIKEVGPQNVIIDALFGSGISRKITGLGAEVIRIINLSPSTVVAVDMPSGLFADSLNPGDGAVIEASYTLSFQTPKLAFFLPENYQYVGDWQIVDIGLDQQFIEDLPSNQYSIDPPLVKKFDRLTGKFSHKGNFGHALLVAGAKGKMGAAVLAAKSALRGGLGLLTIHTPICGYEILQTTVHEAMCQLDADEAKCTRIPLKETITTVGIGPGLGVHRDTVRGFKQLLEHTVSAMVVDADGLNILSQHRESLHLLPPNSILTPHPKEFQRLAGVPKNDYHRLQIQQDFAEKYQVILIHKGAHTTVAMPDGRLFFNTTGNQGMATAGSGDVLTGLVLGLLTRTQNPELAAVLGVYLHGIAGDLAAGIHSAPALTAGDIIEQIGPAIKLTNLRL